MRSLSFTASMLALVLAGCSAPGDDARDVGPDRAGADRTGPELRLNPAELADCTPVTASVRWHVPETQGISAVDVHVGTPETLFAQGGAQGESTTGNWVQPGTTFVLRDRSTGDELARSTVSGPACEAGAGN